MWIDLVFKSELVLETFNVPDGLFIEYDFSLVINRLRLFMLNLIVFKNIYLGFGLGWLFSFCM